MDGPLLARILGEKTTLDSAGGSIPLHISALKNPAVSKLQDLIYQFKPCACVETGCGQGISTLAILYALERLGSGGSHLAIDPLQTSAYKGAGVAAVERADLSGRFELMEEPSHLVLPRLLDQQRRFDFIFIDGHHSFDYVFVDFFYADLLLKEGGILVFDDVWMPQVHHVCWFLQTHKAYRRLGPVTAHPLSPFHRIRQRLLHPKSFEPVDPEWGAIKSFYSDPQWGTLRAFQKLRNTTVHHAFYYSSFYPYFAFHRWGLRLRGMRPH